jgi:uncharacterized protein (TIGR03437 family)
MRLVQGLVAFSLLSGTAHAQSCAGIHFYTANTLSPFNSGKFLGFARPNKLPYFTATVNVSPPYSPSLPADNGNLMLMGCFAGNPQFVSPVPDFQAGAASQRAAIINTLDHTNMGLAMLFYGQPTTLRVWKLNENLTVNAPVDYKFGSGLAGVLDADFNGDGKPDLVVADFPETGPGSIFILINNGDLSFKTPVSYPLPGGALSVTTGDFNKDGKLDLAVATNSFSNGTTVGGVSILLGNGDGTFRAGASYPAGQTPTSIANADLNGDGNLDLVVNDRTANTIGYMAGNGDGTFKPVTKLFSATTPSFVAIGDFNNDGRPDIAYASANLDSVAVALNQSGFTYAAPQTYAAVFSPESLIVTDVNQDGHVDLLVGIGSPDAIGPDINSGQVAVLLNNGDGTLQGAQLYPAGNSPLQIVAADFDGDGNLDVAAANQFGNPTVMYGTGPGKFGAPTTLQGNGSTGIATADFDGDGKPDLAISTSSGVTIELSRSGRTFQSSSVALTGGTAAVVTADFNADGHQDVAAALGSGTGGGSNSVSGIVVLLGDGKGGFGAPVMTQGISASFLAAADLNGDGKPDLVAALASTFTSTGQTTPGLTVLLGKGDGTFSTGQTLFTTYVVQRIQLVDVNGDGKLDLIVTIDDANFGNFVGIALGKGDGTFNTPTTVKTDFGPEGIAVADLNGDKRLDLAVAHCCGATDMTYLLGNGDGTFQPEVHFSGGTSPYDVLAMDLNKDGKIDLLVANKPGGGGFVTPLLNISSMQAMLVNVNGASFAPTPLAPDSIVTAFGTNLAGSDPSATTVTVTDSAGASRMGSLFYVSVGQVNYQMPPGTATGNAKVTIASPAGTSSSNVWITAVGPAFFLASATTGLAAGAAVRVSPDGTQTPIDISQPIDLGNPGDQVVLTLYATGLRHFSSMANVKVQIGDTNAALQYAGPQGSFVGLDQVNVVIPPTLGGKGLTDIDLIVDGVQALPATLTIK